MTQVWALWFIAFFSLFWWDFVFRFVIFHLHRKDLFNVNASCNLIPSKCQCSNMDSANFNSWKGISLLDECCLSPFRTLVWVFPVLPAVIWSVTCWQRAAHHQLWSLQPANSRWWKTGPSATKQPWQHKISLRSSHKDCTSTSGQVGLPICGWGFGYNADAGCGSGRLLPADDVIRALNLCIPSPRWCQTLHRQGASGGRLSGGSLLSHGSLLLHERWSLPPENAG